MAQARNAMCIQGCKLTFRLNAILLHQNLFVTMCILIILLHCDSVGTLGAVSMYYIRE